MAKLYFNYSSMNAGKTTVLLQSAHNYRERGMTPMLFTPKLAQFLSREQVFQLTEIVDRLNIPVLCFGLRTDFQGELFEGSTHLLAWADELAEIKTICHTGRKATMVVRVDDEGYALKEGAQVEIGGNERYVSVSRAEFKNVFVGGQRIKFIEPVEDENPDEETPGAEHRGDRLL
jgi:thymidine kinase